MIKEKWVMIIHSVKIISQHCNSPKSNTFKLSQQVRIILKRQTWSCKINLSVKFVYNLKKIERHLAYIEAKTEEYLVELEQNDQTEKSIEHIKNVQAKIEKLKINKIKYDTLQKQLEEKNTEIAGLNEYIEKLESIATPSKLKKLNPEKFTEENIVEQPVSNLFAIKVNDGSSF